jgi:peptidoglycan-associated lipoprotein
VWALLGRRGWKTARRFVMERGLLGKSSVAVFAVLMAATFVTTGCSSKRDRGVYEGEIGGDVSAADPSIDQFEGSGEVAAGGVFQDVSFAFDSDRLDPMAMDAVRNNAGILESNSGMRVEIEGHSDERGSSEYNLARGARRARSVRDALIGLGVSAERMSTVSYGEELPLCKEATESCYAENRRGHLVELRR